MQGLTEEQIAQFHDLGYVMAPDVFHPKELEPVRQELAGVVDREVRALLDRIGAALTGGHPRALLEQAALALLDYIEEETSGFRVLVRESPAMSPTGQSAR